MLPLDYAVQDFGPLHTSPDTDKTSCKLRAHAKASRLVTLHMRVTIMLQLEQKTKIRFTAPE